MPKRGRTVARDGPHPVDILVGGRLRDFRTARGMSQEKLGQTIGLTFQQIQKYERGANRISASRLWVISEVLDVPVDAFFDDGAPAPKRPATPLEEARDDAHALVEAFMRIEPQNVRDALRTLFKRVAGDEI